MVRHIYDVSMMFFGVWFAKNGVSMAVIGMTMANPTEIAPNTNDFTIAFEERDESYWMQESTTIKGNSV